MSSNDVLPVDDSTSTSSSNETSRSTTPIESERLQTPAPIGQLTILYLIQFTEPLTADVIYPFVNQFVRRTGITHGDEKKTGYYAGIIESVFFVAEACTAFLWQRLSDRFGRRTILLFAPLGLAASMFLFGGSKIFATLVIARCFQGIFNGNIGVVRTVMGEITDSTNRADVIAYIPVVWSIGACFAPFIGGTFSDPAEHWPDTFGKLAFFRENPYFLPCAIAGTICFIAFIITLVGLNETSPAVLHARRKSASDSEARRLLDDRPHENYGAIAPDADEEDEFKPPTFKSLMTKPIVMVLLAYMAFAFVDMCTYALLPPVWSTSIENGGLGFTARRIGTINAIFGIPNALFQILLLGRMLRYLGAKKLSIIAFTGTLCCLLMNPITNALAREAGGTDWKVWTAIVIQLLFLSTLYAGYASLSMFLLEISPSPSALGTIQGLGQTMSVVSRSFAPTIATSLFAFSTDGNHLGGYLVFVVLGLLDVGAIIFACFLPNI